MINLRNIKSSLKYSASTLCFTSIMLVATNTYGVQLSQSPLFLNAPVSPIVMLNMSNDHQLFFKAYDDYSDLDKDDVPDKTYKHTIDYYGYFDFGKCYEYKNSRFEPLSITTDKYCTGGAAGGEWSGNFLNWATMTRIDTVRKMLYGGYRSTDEKDITVLERAFLPNDAHSFAKYYNGNDIAKLTPVSASAGNGSGDGLTICNTTVEGGQKFSQNSKSPPLMRVVKGNYSLWAANERWQCRWYEEKSGSFNNGNNSAVSGIVAYKDSPKEPSGGSQGDYQVKIKACVKDLIGNEDCKAYPQALKPIGLLQTYGDTGQIDFGLLTGSYGKNKSGGVLRKNISSMANEVNVATDGTFKVPSDGSIVKTLDTLRLYGYDYNDGFYNNSDSGGDDCKFQLFSFNDGKCRNWGNPQSEIYQESLKYLTGGSVSSKYNTDDSGLLAGLVTATWKDPMSSSNSCAPLNILQFNASTSSYDGDQLSNGATVTADTDVVGSGEGIQGKKFFVGESGTDLNQLCTAKEVGLLSAVKGTCPDAPRLEGSYKLAGLAYGAKTTDIRTDLPGTQSVKTYGIALSPAVPRIDIPVPGSSKKITLLPACRNTGPDGNNVGNCAIVDFKIVEQNHTANPATGKLYVNWEDSEQGGDFDQDMWGVIDYEVSNTTVKVTTDVIAESTSGRMGFGYVLSGTTKDGFHVASGIEGFKYPSPFTGITGCTDCQVGNPAVTNTFSVGTADAELLEQPLYYAAKWGGFNDLNNDKKPNSIDEWDVDGDGIPDTYFYATNPAELEVSLSKALAQVAADGTSSSSVATNSTRLDTGTLIYQARFSSSDWSGQMIAYKLTADGTVGSVSWDSNVSGQIPTEASRRIFTSKEEPLGTEVGTELAWSNLTASQQSALGGGDASLGEKRLAWLRGSRSAEQPIGELRQRKFILGDVVNSDPVFVGEGSYRYETMPVGTTGQSTYAAFVASKVNNTPLLLVNSNDGMLHGFDAETGKELFAYMPRSIFGSIADITKPDYGNVTNQHKYLVDGPIFVGDAYVGGSWKTIAVSSFGAGQRGIFALDITNAGNSTGFQASDVLFEISDWDEIGNVMTAGVIGRLPDGTWGAVFGNGVNSVDGKAKLLIVNLNDPTDRLAIDTTGTSGALGGGLSGPAVLASGRDFSQAYAGDMLGNLWRFNFSTNDRATWKVAYGTTSQPVPLFKAVNNNGLVQPITSVPEVGKNPYASSNPMIFFGSGSYMAASDAVVSSTPRVETFYGIVDAGSPIIQPSGTPRTNLQEQSILTEYNKTGYEYRTTSATDVSYPPKSGWFMDLVSPGPVAIGERVVSSPILRFGLIIFPTLIPSQTPCSAGGDSWLMIMDAWGGKQLNYAVFSGNPDLVGGRKSSIGIIKTPAFISAGDKWYLPAGGSTGDIDVTQLEGDGTVGRHSWRQLR